jgi:hypothetical protein
MVVLDTNHITVLGYATTASAALLRRLDDSKEDAVTTVITLEEQMRGWLAAIQKAQRCAPSSGGVRPSEDPNGISRQMGFASVG